MKRSVLALLVVSAACGGDSESTKLSTGVAGTTTLSAATEAETQKICTATAAWTKKNLSPADSKTVSCKLAGVVAGAPAMPPMGMPAGDPSTVCTAATNACLAVTAPDAGAPTTTAMCPPFGASCSATVAEYEACINDGPLALTQLAAAIPTCDMVTNTTNSSLVLFGLLTHLPPSCQTLAGKCQSAILTIPGFPVLTAPTSSGR